MITKAQAKVGQRVEWRSLDESIPAAPGIITAVKPNGEIKITYDDGEDGSTYIESRAQPARYGAIVRRLAFGFALAALALNVLVAFAMVTDLRVSYDFIAHRWSWSMGR